MPGLQRFIPFICMFIVTTLSVTFYAEYMHKIELSLFGPDEYLGPLGVPYTPFWWDTLWSCIATAAAVYWLILAYELKKVLTYGEED